MRPLRFFPVLLFLLVFVQTQGFSQQGIIYKAIILDSLEKVPVEKCTVSLLGKNGVISKKATDNKGLFSFTIKQDSVHLLFQHLGYTEKTVLITRSKATTATDTIYLASADKRMEGIVVKTKLPFVVQKGDTTEFNIDSALFEPFDVVADLLKRLPGLEIDAEGKLTYQGKPINRVLVDGEDLFGGDPNFSLRKLPAGLVAKIQVMDTKSLEQLFSGTTPDGEEKTLNIRLKPGNKTFGSAEATVGTKSQLESNGSVSQFDGAKKLSLMGTLTTSNKIGFNKISSGPTSSSANIGANYSNNFGKHRINGSYSYSDNGNSNNLYRERTQVITTDTSIFTRSSNYSDFNSSGHRVSLGNNWLIDSTSSLDINLVGSTGRSESQNSALSATRENGALRNESLNKSSTLGDNQSLTGNIVWVKRFGVNGRRLSINARTNMADQISNMLSQSTNTYFKGGMPVSGDTLDRQTKTKNRNRAYGVNFMYIEPITKHLRFDLRADLDMNRMLSIREVYNLDSNTKRAVFDSTYSSIISSTTHTQNLSAAFNYSHEKWNVSTGLSTVLQQAVRLFANEDVQQNLLRYSPSVNASYFLSKQQSLRVSFTANTLQPTIDQLQPVPDNSNPLFVRIGNPNLRTAFAQNYSLSYNVNNSTAPVHQSFSAGIGYAPISNQIVNAIFFDEYRRQTSQFVNVSGVYNMRGNLSFSRNKQIEKTITGWNLSSNGSYGQQAYFQSNKQYYSHNYNTGLSVSFNKREMAVRAGRYSTSLSASFSRNWTPADLKVLNTTRLNIAPQIEVGGNLFEFVYLASSYRLWYNKLDYHSNLRRNDEYSMHHLSSEISLQLQKKYWVNASINYQYNTQVPLDMPKGVINCNVSARGQVLKNRAQIVVTAVDLFAMSRNLRRIVGENFIEDLQIDNLQNYFTFRFQYNFSRIDKKERNKG